MHTIVAGRIVTSVAEYTEVALGDTNFVPTASDLHDFAEFVEDTTTRPGTIDAENLAWLQRQARSRRGRLATVVPLPRRGTTVLARKGAAA